jgi:hypothetical protein
MSTRRVAGVRVLLVFAKALIIAVVLVLLAAYFGWHVREAGGTAVAVGLPRGPVPPALP